MSGQTHFYATREDLEPVMLGIESARGFRYALTGMHRERTFPEYLSALDIPSLGRATGDQAMTCEAYLVVSKEEMIAIREIRQNSGGVRYAVDQLANPRSIVFQSGGLRDGGVIIHGRISTAAMSEEAQAILSLFKKWLKKTFVKHRAFYVGPSAMRLKQEGARLTMAVQSSRDFDLV